MSQAVTHGKISSSGANLTSASEDLLVGTVFGSLRYLPAKDLLIPILQESTSKFDKKLQIEEDNDPKITFWPLYKNSEPDLVIEFDNHLIFIEAKLYAGKSGDFDIDSLEEEKEVEVAASQDQLTREFLDLKEQASINFISISLIYLTAHRVRPINSINRSILASKRLEKIDADEFAKNIYWLSWYDVWNIVAEFDTSDKYKEAIVADIVSYLERLGLKHFTGFSKNTAKQIQLNEKPIFYQG